jgi:hypothetical protein
METPREGTRPTDFTGGLGMDKIGGALPRRRYIESKNEKRKSKSTRADHDAGGIEGGD